MSLPEIDINKLRISIYGRILYWCLSKNKSTILSNFDQVFKNSLSPNQKKHLAKALFSHMARTIKESYLFHRNKKNFKPRIEIRGLHHLNTARDAGKGVVLLGSHSGSWELTILGGQTQTEAAQKNPYIIRRKQHPLLQKILNRLYKNAGINIIEKNGALHAACKALSNQDTVVFVFDTHVSLDKKHGIPVEFFGKKTGCNRSLAVIAKRSKAPVVPTHPYRINSNHHVLEFHPALPWINCPDKKKELYENTLQYNKALEQFIMQHPEQWWSWVYRHWW